MREVAWELAGAPCLSQLAADKNVRAPTQVRYEVGLEIHWAMSRTTSAAT
jgi:hypothetical protein